VNTFKTFIASITTAGAVALAPIASADQYRDSYNDSWSSGGDHTSWARVTHVEPLTETVEVNQPREECRTERVSRQVPVDRGYGHREHQQHRSARSYTPEILGAVIGGAIGRKAGRGRGQDVATVAGAVLGGSIGRDISRRNRHGSDRYAETRYETRYEDVRHCETVDNFHTEERVVGYRVQYEYDGRTYWTRTQADPGNRIKVRVSVAPVAWSGSDERLSVR